MPYIIEQERPKYEDYLLGIENILYHLPATQAASEFTYIIYRLLKRFNVQFWHRALGIGCMVCAILEMYRTHHSTYEEGKRNLNGEA